MFYLVAYIFNILEWNLLLSVTRFAFRLTRIMLRIRDQGHRLKNCATVMFSFVLSNSYTVVCPPVRGDNLRALASGFISRTDGPP